MSLPVENYALATTTNISICTLLPAGSLFAPLVAGATNVLPTGQMNLSPMLDIVAVYIAAGSSGVGTVVTPQELGGDGTWRAIPAFGNYTGAVTLANSTNYYFVIGGPFNGFRLTISGVVGNGVAFAEAKASVRDK